MNDYAGEDRTKTDAPGSIIRVITPREKDLGGFVVRRVLPARDCRRVGPFVFFDHVGPADFPPGHGIQVRPHPHIGLATVTYLFEGEIIHRDSLGFVQPIQPGAVNLMTAGSGIVHSERAGKDVDIDSRLHGIQIWIALPIDQEQCEPAFEHYPAAEIPELDVPGATVKVIMGEAHGRRSPVRSYTPTVYLEYRLAKGGIVTLPDTYRELAVYPVAGDVRIDRLPVGAGAMAVVRPETSARLAADADSHVLVIGGDPIGERHIWWNFVSSSAERIDRAKADWKEGRFGLVPGDNELIPLPD